MPSRPPEERILICNQRLSIGFDRENLDAEGKPVRLYSPCGNLLKILVHFPDSVEGAEPYMVEAVRSDVPDSNGRRYGACITHHYENQRFGGTVRFTYGPKRLIYFNFLHCRRCYKRWAWKRFRKADV